MAKQVIILEVQQGPGGDNNLHIVGWFPVPVGKEMPGPATSVWGSASPGEVAAIAAGQVIEEDYWTQYAPGTTKPQIKADLQIKWAARNSAIQAKLTAVNPKQFYGVFWDSVNGWSA